MLSRLALGVAKLGTNQRVAARSISTFSHYGDNDYDVAKPSPKSIPKPICLHHEAKKIATTLSRKYPKDYTKAYDTAMNTLQEELKKARYKAIAAAKDAIREEQ